MATPNVVYTLAGLSPDLKEVCTIEATVVTGFESAAKEECLQKMNSKAITSRGRIFFDVPVEKVPDVLKLRSVDNVYLVLKMVKSFDFPQEKEKALEKVMGFVNEPDWDKGLKVWQKVSGFQGNLHPPAPSAVETKVQPVLASEASGEAVEEGHDVSSCGSLLEPVKKQIKIDEELMESKSKVNAEEKLDEETDEKDKSRRVVGDSAENGSGVLKADREVEDRSSDVEGGESSEGVPKFRVTCYRTGKKHRFGSMDAARDFGGAVYEKFHWKVDMTKFDIEVVLNIDEDQVYVCLGLTKESLHKRNITHFGPTTLRATICHNMLTLAKLQPGDIVVDPMCGGGSIPIEGAIAFPGIFGVCGDIHEKAITRTLKNVEYLNSNGPQLCVDTISWNACNLPFRDQSVDVFVTDLPFGKRSGSRRDNRQLYPQTLREMARVCRSDTGRAVILTQDRKNMDKSLQFIHSLWRRQQAINVNIGGLSGTVFLLQRLATLK